MATHTDYYIRVAMEMAATLQHKYALSSAVQVCSKGRGNGEQPMYVLGVGPSCGTQHSFMRHK